MKFSRQFDQMDCGPACVRMVASYYGKDYPLSYLRSLAHLTREGVSVAGIRDSLTAIGMNSATFEMSLEQLYTDCPLPTILYWDQNHFVVLEKLKGRSAQKARYKIANPAFGKQWFSAEELCRNITAKISSPQVAKNCAPMRNFLRRRTVETAPMRLRPLLLSENCRNRQFADGMRPERPALHSPGQSE